MFQLNEREKNALEVCSNAVKRKILFSAMVGSTNYNLNSNSSDKDYKCFVLPSFDDLYDGVFYSKSIISDVVDLDVHDIRKITKLFWKSNINFMEVLFSREIVINPEIEITSKDNLFKLFFMRNEIAVINLPYLFNACVGMSINKKNSVEKGTEGTQDLVLKYGYDTKQAQHSIRVLNFLERFLNTNFNFQKAIYYPENDKDRDMLLNIKNGNLSLNEYYNFHKNYLEKIEEIKEEYISKKLNNELLKEIEDLIKNIIKEEM